MFKKMMITTGLVAALFSATAFASEPQVSATVTAQSEYNYRGQSISDEASVGAVVRVDDLLFDGLFVSGDFNTLSLAPSNDARFRSDVGVGYAGTASNLRYSFSLNRVINPTLYSADYNEFRARAGYSFFFAEVARGLTDGVNTDTYVALGAEAQFTKRWTGSAKASVIGYDAGANRFNNLEVSTTYNVWGNLDAFATYSEGGRDLGGEEIRNQVWGGLQYRF